MKYERPLWHKTEQLITGVNGRVSSVVILENVMRVTADRDGTVMQRVCQWNRQILPNER